MLAAWHNDINSLQDAGTKQYLMLNLVRRSILQVRVQFSKVHWMLERTASVSMGYDSELEVQVLTLRIQYGTSGCEL